MVGLAGTVNDGGNVMVIVLPATKAPATPAVKPTVQVAAAPADWEEPAKVTFANPVRTTAADGEVAVVSTLVETEKSVLG